MGLRFMGRIIHRKCAYPLRFTQNDSSGSAMWVLPESLTAKTAMPAKEKKSLTAKAAVDARGTTIGSSSSEEREGNAKHGNGQRV